MKKKYYAVKVGRIPGIYQTWAEAEPQVKGYAGAKYKSFPTMDEAEQFILEHSSPSESIRTNQESEDTESINKTVDNIISNLGETECLAAVDGSYNPESEKAGFGVILISYGNNKDTLYKAFPKSFGEDFVAHRNVSVELEGVKEAINWAINSKKTKITILYDYEGIEKWVNGDWKAKTTLTKQYVDFMHDSVKKINVNFIKVPAHSGIDLNEEADSLAKYSLLAKGHKTYSDGSVYFTGYRSEDWKAIIDFINEETSSIVEENANKVSYSVEIIGNREKIVLKHLNDRVVINCYPHGKSYVQGKQSVLFQKIIVTAIEGLSTKQDVVETLNCYHALSITQDSVEMRFDELLPDFKGNKNEKIYFNLLSAIYNTMLTGYMPDYTCLITPIFRAYEYCLHKVLGDKMSLETTRENGTNNFAYFQKNKNGTYECNNSAKNILSQVQQDYLNKLYTSYNAVRHPYSHWSADDYDTAVIPDMKTARDHLQKGLTIINNYYKIF